MELANQLYQGQSAIDEGRHPEDVTVTEPPRKLSLANNFSYPRPETQMSRHESSDSRSSLTSNGSVPGMTDSSDSETSFDEDSSYNTSASELWDSFWPDRMAVPEEQYPALLRESQTPNYFTKNFPKQEAQEADDTITVSKLENASQEDTVLSSDVPASRRAVRGSAPSYSVYPKLQPTSALRVNLPPRTSSLSTVPSSPPPSRRHILKPSNSNTNLKSSSKFPYAFQQNYAFPPATKVPIRPTSPRSVPVSPAYPPPPPPRTLRAASSALNLRDKRSPLNQIQNNTPFPLSPPFSMMPPPMPETPPASRPELERYVSVFEFDSDRESYVESSSFKKRIVRGFHKKSASEKRDNNERRSSADSNTQSKEGSNRKRGGSLGRILGLRSR
ncbi:uncharacterized protein GGS25DRAFT_421089 [Hypoxylon fragiforme]|uniref:uncharacterized protein n=1 Tax=Hypoxylon fragiforme TaxID=63214 RepID=UPI0020C6B6D3|nr:uncharacterized protein GGS25DRAFT_421089 [Hypoxylon fragiforme]KAI2605208.1 hypothetical protein GGS25DRAFT_421089 [Hypoxylon fragiforme]